MSTNFTPGQLSSARAISQVYAKYGLDPTGDLAVVMNESNANPNAVGDNGTSFGTNQLHQGGALGNHSAAWAMNPINDATMTAQWLVSHGGKGLSGAAEQKLLTQGFERPANTAGDMNPANLTRASALLKALGVTPPASAQTLGAATDAAQQALTGQSSQNSKQVGMGLLAGFMPGGSSPYASSLLNNGDILTQAVYQKTAQQPAQTTGHPASDAAAGAVGSPGGNQDYNIAVSKALGQKGVPYQWGGTTPGKGLDCSGLTQYAWAQAGVKIPRTTYEQISALPHGPTNPAQWRPGDLIYPEAGHVGMYIGNGQIVEAPHTGTVVQVVPVSQGWSTPYAVRRPG